MSVLFDLFWFQEYAENFPVIRSGIWEMWPRPFMTIGIFVNLSFNFNPCFKNEKSIRTAL